MLATPIATNAKQEDAMPAIAAQILGYILEHVAEEIELTDLAQVAGMSDSSFCRSFARACGLPPMRWLWNFRAVLAAEFIKIDPRWSLTDVAFACGFTSSAHFSRSFKAVLGVAPLAYKKQILAAQPKGLANKGTLIFDCEADIGLRVATQIVTKTGRAASSGGRLAR